ncbi:MAG: META domain-containing protein [Telluria sp.]
MTRNLLVSTCLALMVGGCASSAPPGSAPASTPPLEGTAWELVELQSMDDAQGIRRPEIGAQYRLQFGADGRLSAQLDCNRGMGPWKADPSGGLRLGPLATTRALCPPSSLGGTVAMQLDSVRSYLVRDGKLNLSLMADGGIMVWKPAAAPR